MGSFQVVVIGGGHAGVEAARAAAQFGLSVGVVTLRRAGVGQMSCNPAIGGLGKGHLVKEVDALGGIMGRAIDATGIQFRMLNASKGPAVQASRAQADRDLYKQKVLDLLEAQPGVTVIEGEVSRIELDSAGRVRGVVLADGSPVACRALIVTTGTFLRGLMHTGSDTAIGGRRGDIAALGLSGSLRELGLPLIRLKTGTPPRIRKSSIDFSLLVEQQGDDPPRPFSMMTDRISQRQIPCWMTSTNESVHEIIAGSRERSPLFNGQIQSVGPRYCPSIEDKVFRFPEKTSHTIFLEPEGYDSDLVYPNGISTSLPLDVQYAFVRSIRGLEQAEIVQPGYAVEYDAVDPRSLGPTLETKGIPGLFLAGQINGTSGYEEAAGQGILAGINAGLFVLERPSFEISRGDGYIGVMVDDLITNGVDEPYRMFTSRAEYRLVLREDNAPERLCPRAAALGLLSPEQQERFELRVRERTALHEWAMTTKIKASPELDEWLAQKGSGPLRDTVPASVLVRRPEVTLQEALERFGYSEAYSNESCTAVETALKFEGYLKRQEEEIARVKKAEAVRIPDDFCYDSVPSIRVELREKLKRVKPSSLGQALRIPGMTPSAVSLLSIYLKKSREAA